MKKRLALLLAAILIFVSGFGGLTEAMETEMEILEPEPEYTESEATTPEFEETREEMLPTEAVEALTGDDSTVASAEPEAEALEDVFLEAPEDTGAEEEAASAEGTAASGEEGAVAGTLPESSRQFDCVDQCPPSSALPVQV